MVVTLPCGEPVQNHVLRSAEAADSSRVVPGGVFRMLKTDANLGRSRSALDIIRNRSCCLAACLCI